jgi:hypothetical protein
MDARARARSTIDRSIDSRATFRLESRAHTDE